LERARKGRGAYQSIVSFDAGYTSCSVDNVLGRAGGGPVTRRLKNGAVIEIIRSEFSGKSCAIRDGNAIAN
jgi:hypothetical protein